jgi:hypothetical protein
MLSTAAWNAFLKSLEEPPPHVKFIFATAEVHKVPATILSRCQRYDFKLIPHADDRAAPRAGARARGNRGRWRAAAGARAARRGAAARPVRPPPPRGGVRTVASLDAEKAEKRSAELAKARAAVENHPVVQEIVRLFGAQVREVKLPSLDG